MNLPWFWDCLDLTPVASTRDVKRRYSQLLKLNRPEDNPEGFQQLRAAYEICLQLARQREEASGEAAACQAAAVPVSAAPQPLPVAAPSEAPPDAAPFRLEAELPPPEPPAAEPLRLDAQPPQPPAPRPVVRVDSDPPPAPLQTVDASTIGQFLPVEMALPRLRPAAAVVDELLHLDNADPAALPRWFARCPEMANFEQRDAVELELLQRLAGGARPSLAVLKQASDEFGWRELGFARRLAARGISGPRWQAIDDALHQAFADAQFAVHLNQGDQLLSRELSLRAERQLLERLHARRGQRPSLWRAFLGTDVLRVNNLLHAYAKHYGGRALYHVFGAPFLDFWRDAHPGSAPNWLRFRLIALRVMSYLVPLWLGLMILAGQDENLEPAMLGMNHLQAVFSVMLLMLAAGLIIYAGANLAFQHFQQNGWQRFTAWRDQWLERRVEPWLHPLRALPLLLALGGLLVLLRHWPGDAAGKLLCAGLALVLFGFSGLAALACAALMLSVAITGWSPPDPPWVALAGGGALAVVWSADRLSLRAPRRWTRRFGLSLLLAFAVTLGSGVVHDLVGR